MVRGVPGEGSALAETFPNKADMPGSKIPQMAVNTSENSPSRSSFFYGLEIKEEI